ncbi:sensor histidine kinase [Bradyrhizobium guangdongense]|uniref:sensor histidine kinase n=1 Tax=Bradyrhizobium guangdongense TaxID=1325090 RepID=UPI001319FA6F|nr:HWE histidine kinase domain-containing protein [Bradyrhizobium guangdongense]
MRSQARLPDPVAAVIISHHLADRQSAAPDFLREKLAIQDLAEVMSAHPEEILPRLVRTGMEICGAHSAGISIFEPEANQFRWHALAGELSTFEGATTPRNFSPCGVCLDLAEPILMKHPERAYDWIGDARITVPEVLLVPLGVKSAAAIGTLWLVSGAGHFNKEHARITAELAAFAGMALRMIQSEQKLALAMQRQETLMREMSHRIKNLFSVADSMVRMTARNAATKEELAETLSGRLHALSEANGLIRRSFGDDVAAVASLGDLVGCILRPHGVATSNLNGPPVAIGEQAANHLALVFHELATNAAKYGPLSRDKGEIDVTWSVDADRLEIDWTETGADAVAAPTSTGFGTKLVETTIERIGGSIRRAWNTGGLSVAISLPLGSLGR